MPCEHTSLGTPFTFGRSVSFIRHESPGAGTQPCGILGVRDWLSGSSGSQGPSTQHKLGTGSSSTGVRPKRRASSVHSTHSRASTQSGHLTAISLRSQVQRAPDSRAPASTNHPTGTGPGRSTCGASTTSRSVVVGLSGALQGSVSATAVRYTAPAPRVQDFTATRTCAQQLPIATAWAAQVGITPPAFMRDAYPATLCNSQPTQRAQDWPSARYPYGPYAHDHQALPHMEGNPGVYQAAYSSTDTRRRGSAATKCHICPDCGLLSTGGGAMQQTAYGPALPARSMHESEWGTCSCTTTVRTINAS